MAAGALLFALMNFFARVATASSSWASVGAVRALVGALVAVAVARARGASLSAHDRGTVFWRSVFGTAAMVSTFHALSSRALALGDTVTLLNLTPIFLAVLAPVFLRERTSRNVALALVISLAGVALIVRPAFLFGDAAPLPVVEAARGPGAHVTAAVAVLAALMTSIAMMLLRRAGRSDGAEAIALHFSLFAAATLSILAALDWRTPTKRDLACMVAAGVCAGFGQLAMARAYALGPAARVSGMSYLTVVGSALLGALVLREVPTPWALFGMALVIAGGLLITFTRDEAA